jgi:putative colanic acid biosynthesis acetyltransferase WcaF
MNSNSNEQPPVFQDLTQFRVPEGFRGANAIVVQLWWIVQNTLFGTSPQVLYGWRRCLLRLFGAKIGQGVLIRPSARFTYPWKVTIGDHSWIGDDVVVYSLAEIEIGSHSVISQRSYLCAGSHDFRRVGFDIFGLPIRIGSQCWLAADVFVGPGRSIGDGTVVGARSTVLRDLPPAMICHGTPAVPVGRRYSAFSAPHDKGLASA